MAGEQQASVSPEAKVAETQTPGAGDPSAAAKVEAEAQAAEASEEDKVKAANDKLAERGRELKAERERAKALEAQLEAEREAREKLWYTHPETPEEEKQAFRSRREQAAKDAPKIASLQNRIALSDAIADEDNPVVRSALKAMRVKAEASGKYPDADMITSIRESLTPSVEAEERTEEKAPPGVSAVRGTRASAGPSIDDQIKAVEDSIRKHDGKFQYGDLLALRQQKTMEEAAARK
jgi:hypothetical protein